MLAEVQQQRQDLASRLTAAQTDIINLQNSHQQDAEEAGNTLKVSCHVAQLCTLP